MALGGDLNGGGIQTGFKDKVLLSKDLEERKLEEHCGRGKSMCKEDG